MTSIKFRSLIRQLIKLIQEEKDGSETAGKKAYKIVKDLFDWYDNEVDD